MARTQNLKYREAKRNNILDCARLVFCRKGYLNVTMQDIIDECGISRGGIYLYYSSIDKIFQDVVSRRNKTKFSVIRKAVGDNQPFESVFGNFMKLQKERLLHMENSLLRAMYEYIFSKAQGVTPTFRNTQLNNLRQSVLSILTLGIKQQVVKDEDIQPLTDHFVVVIEGLGLMALTEVLTEKIVDEQFALLDSLIKRM